MPIASILQGMKERGEAFRQIGSINKGAAKGPKGEMGKDLAYFRFTLEPGEDEASRILTELYGDQPNHIRVRLPLPQVDRVWESWLEAYVAGAMIARLGAHPTIHDGNDYVSYWRNPKTGELRVRNWQAETAIETLGVQAGQPVRYTGFPVYRYRHSKTGEPVDVLPKPVGRLQVLIPELRRLVYFVLKTGSWNDCVNISRQLGALEVIQQLRGKHVAGVPLILSRIEDEISTPSGEGGGRARRKKWLISIEPDPDWVEEHIAQLDADVRPLLKEISAPPSELPTPLAFREEADDNGAPVDEVVTEGTPADAAEDPFTGEDLEIFDQRGSPDPEQIVAAPDEHEAEAMTWQAAYEGLQLPKSRYNATLEQFAGDFHRAYDFIMAQRAAATTPAPAKPTTAKPAAKPTTAKPTTAKPAATKPVTKAVRK